MADIGFNDNLEVAGRKFHFQTASNVDKGSVRCEIFENGTVLATSSVDFERRKQAKQHTVENRIKNTVESLAAKTTTISTSADLITSIALIAGVIISFVAFFF